MIVLLGPPGAGTSSFAAELGRRGSIEAGAVISSDAIASELFGVIDPRTLVRAPRMVRRYGAWVRSRKAAEAMPDYAPI